MSEAENTKPPDPATGRERLAARFAAADLDPDRFIPVEAGAKASYGHTQHPPDADELAPPKNYGIYANGDDALVILDVDDYNDLDDESGLLAVQGLPETLEQHSPHGGKHRPYVVETDDDRTVAEVLEDEFGAQNPQPSYGEVRVANQYVVGAGSQLDGCDKDGCDECATAEGGRYTFGPSGEGDRPLATLDVATLLDALRADPALRDDGDDPSQSELGRAVADHGDDPDHNHRGHDLSDEELIEKAMNAENGDKFRRLWRGDTSLHDDDHSRADLALCCQLAFWTGRDERRIERLFDQSGLADRAKWQDRPDYRERTIAEACRRQTKVYDPDGEAAQTPPVVADDETVHAADDPASVVTTPTQPMGDLHHRKGCYGYVVERRDDTGEIVETEFDTVCNFTMEFVARVETYEGEQLVVRVHPQSPREDAYEVEVAPTVFHDAATFKEEVACGLTTWFNPDRNAYTALKDLRLTVVHQNANTYRGSEFIGPHASDDDPRKELGTPSEGAALDELVTPHGTLTADGWADDATYTYYEKGGSRESDSSLAEKWRLSPTDGDDYDRAVVRDILTALPTTRKTERSVPVLGWFYAAPLRPYLHAKGGEFPLLQVTGTTEVGKTATLELFYEAFGAEASPFGAQDSAWTITKKLAGSSGFPVWLDEYKPTEMGERDLDSLHSVLRAVTRGQTVPKGTSDLGEITFKLRAPVVLTGEQAIPESNAAVRRRTLHTAFSETAKTGTTYESHRELAGEQYTDANGVDHDPERADFTQHALAYYQFVLGRDRPTLDAWWQDARETTREVLRGEDIDLDSLPDSTIHGLTTVAFGVRVFQEFTTAMGVEADHPALPGEMELGAAFTHVVDNIGPDGQRRDHIDDFTELVAEAAREGYIEEGDAYRFFESHKWETEALAFHMPSTFAAVKRYVRDFNRTDDYNLLGKTDYLDNYRDKAETGRSYPLAVNHRVRGLANGQKVVCINIDRAADHLTGFNRRAFTDTDADAARDAVGDDTAGDGNATFTFAGLRPSIEGTHDQRFIATVHNVESAPDWLDGKGMLMDDAGSTATYEVQGGAGHVLPADFEEGARCHFKHVGVKGDNGGNVGTIVITGGSAVEVAASDPATADQTSLRDADTDADGDADTDTDDMAAEADGSSAATPDGGTAVTAADTTEFEGAKGSVHRALANCPEGDEVTVSRVAGSLPDHPPEDVATALDALAEQGVVARTDDPDTYEVL
jgi:hypothetical protein